MLAGVATREAAEELRGQVIRPRRSTSRSDVVQDLVGASVRTPEGRRGDVVAVLENPQTTPGARRRPSSRRFVSDRLRAPRDAGWTTDGPSGRVSEPPCHRRLHHLPRTDRRLSRPELLGRPGATACSTSAHDCDRDDRPARGRSTIRPSGVAPAWCSWPAALRVRRARRPAPPLFLLGPGGRTLDRRWPELADGWCSASCAAGTRRRRPGGRHLVDGELSVGDYVLNGGEVAAMVVLEAVGAWCGGHGNQGRATTSVLRACSSTPSTPGRRRSGVGRARGAAFGDHPASSGGVEPAPATAPGPATRPDEAAGAPRRRAAPPGGVPRAAGPRELPGRPAAPGRASWSMSGSRSSVAFRCSAPAWWRPSLSDRSRTPMNSTDIVDKASLRTDVPSSPGDTSRCTCGSRGHNSACRCSRAWSSSARARHPRDLHRAQAVVRRRRGAHLPVTPRHDKIEVHTLATCAGEAVLPARSHRQGRQDQGEARLLIAPTGRPNRLAPARSCCHPYAYELSERRRPRAVRSRDRAPAVPGVPRRRPTYRYVVETERRFYLANAVEQAVHGPAAGPASSSSCKTPGCGTVPRDPHALRAVGPRRHVQRREHRGNAEVRPAAVTRAASGSCLGEDLARPGTRPTATPGGPATGGAGGRDRLICTRRRTL